MYTVISKNIYIYNPTYEVMEWTKENMVVKNPQYCQYEKIGKAYLNKVLNVSEYQNVYEYNSYDNVLTLPYGVLYAVWRFICNYPYKTIFNNHADIPMKSLTSPVNFYDYQIKAISAMVKNKSGLLISPCGSGKTTMGIEIIHRIGKPFLWLTHTKSLLTQTYNAFKSTFPDIDLGIVSEGKTSYGIDGTIAMVQTLSNIEPSLYADKFDVVVVDEAAHCVGTSDTSRAFSDILSNIPARYKYGLTATPTRSDGLIMTMYMYLGVSRDGRFDATYKVPKQNVKTCPSKHKRFELSFDYNLYQAKVIKDGKPNFTNLITMLSKDERRDEVIINNVIKCDNTGRKQLILCHRVDHCKKLYNRLVGLGIKAALLTGEIKNSEREKIINEEVEWNVVVATYSLLKEGVSIVNLDTLHLATPQVDPGMIVQCAGRIERYKPNKKIPYVVDYVDHILLPSKVPSQAYFDYGELMFYKRQKALIERF